MTSVTRNVGVALAATASVVVVESARAATATQTCEVVKLNDAGSTDHGGSLPSAITLPCTRPPRVQVFLRTSQCFLRRESPFGESTRAPGRRLVMNRFSRGAVGGVTIARPVG